MNSLKARRLELKRTQGQIAKDAGISRSLYAVYESGVSRPSIIRAMLIAKALQTTTDALFGYLLTSAVEEVGHGV